MTSGCSTKLSSSANASGTSTGRPKYSAAITSPAMPRLTKTRMPLTGILAVVSSLAERPPSRSAYCGDRSDALRGGASSAGSCVLFDSARIVGQPHVRETSPKLSTFCGHICRIAAACCSVGPTSDASLSENAASPRVTPWFTAANGTPASCSASTNR
ncbi:hypothetical protein SDC9_175273 [bioreactor metagenome]|uniref:Uncharacterized protein n=1 Tax=bioreactor metagenome TaxID=1076179 RepID=A0A645GPL2_9ZZZZ